MGKVHFQKQLILSIILSCQYTYMYEESINPLPASVVCKQFGPRSGQTKCQAFVCLFCCYGHGGTVSSLNHIFSTFACNWQQPFLNDSAEGRRMTVEIISWSISIKIWDQAGIELTTPGSAVRHASVARHVTDCATRPGQSSGETMQKKMGGGLTISLFF